LFFAGSNSAEVVGISHHFYDSGGAEESEFGGNRSSDSLDVGRVGNCTDYGLDGEDEEQGCDGIALTDSTLDLVALGEGAVGKHKPGDVVGEICPNQVPESVAEAEFLQHELNPIVAHVIECLGHVQECHCDWVFSVFVTVDDLGEVEGVVVDVSPLDGLLLFTHKEVDDGVEPL